MASYDIVFKRSVKKDLRRIDSQHIPRILACIDALAEDPRPTGCKKLTARELYRVRVGEFRIVYEIVDHQLVVIVIGINTRSRA